MPKMNFTLVVVFAIAIFAGHSLAADLEGYQFLKISPQEEKVVVKNPEGTLQLVGVGDILADDAQVIEIVAGRVVLEQPGDDDSVTIIIRLEGQQQRIERISRRGERPLPSRAPVAPAAPGERDQSGYQ